MHKEQVSDSSVVGNEGKGERVLDDVYAPRKHLIKIELRRSWVKLRMTHDQRLERAGRRKKEGRG